jgi:hypothetical protein
VGCLEGAVKLILGDVKQRLVIVGPHSIASGVMDGLLQQLPPALQILHVECELLSALREPSTTDNNISTAAATDIIDMPMRHSRGAHDIGMLL